MALAPPRARRAGAAAFDPGGRCERSDRSGRPRCARRLRPPPSAAAAKTAARPGRRRTTPWCSTSTASSRSAGSGTVVTGTLWSGTVRRGDPVTILPGDVEARVRAIQVHDRPQESAGPHGQRAALNLAGLKLRDVGRGDVVERGGRRLAADLPPRRRSSLQLEEPAAARAAAGPPRHPRRAGACRALSAGTRASCGSSAPVFACERRPGCAAPIAPPATLGGGIVIDAQPRRHGCGPRPGPPTPAPGPGRPRAARSLGRCGRRGRGVSGSSRRSAKTGRCRGGRGRLLQRLRSITARWSRRCPWSPPAS